MTEASPASARKPSTLTRVLIGLAVAIALFFGFGAFHRATTAPEQLAIDDCMREARGMTDFGAKQLWLQHCENLRQEWREKLLANNGK